MNKTQQETIEAIAKNAQALVAEIRAITGRDFCDRNRTLNGAAMQIEMAAHSIHAVAGAEGPKPRTPRT